MGISSGVEAKLPPIGPFTPQRKRAMAERSELGSAPSGALSLARANGVTHWGVQASLYLLFIEMIR